MTVEQQRIRLRYTKEDRVRFVSARDMTSVWERGLRRADLPIAYSEGYTPHPKVSVPDALPVGYASTGEYAELTFAAPIDPGPALGRLSATLPDGMDILTYLDVPAGAPKLARMLGATLWELLLPATDTVSAREQVGELRRMGERLLAADHVEVVRSRPNGEDKVLDARLPLLALRVTARTDVDPPGTTAGTTPALRAVLRNDGPTVRPSDLWNALVAVAPDGVGTLPQPRLYRRVAQGDPVEDGVREALTTEVEPLDPTRSAEAA